MPYPPWIKTVIVHGGNGKSSCKRLRFAISEVAFRGVKGHESHYRQPLMTGTGATKQSLRSYSAAFFRHFPTDVLPRLFPCFVLKRHFRSLAISGYICAIYICHTACGRRLHCARAAAVFHGRGTVTSLRSFLFYAVSFIFY